MSHTSGGWQEPDSRRKAKALLLEKDRSRWQFLTVKATHGGQLGWIGEWVRGEGAPGLEGIRGGVRGEQISH